MTAPAVPAEPAAGPPVLTRGATRRLREIGIGIGVSVLLYLASFMTVLAIGVLIWTIYDHGWDRLMADPVAFFSNFVSRFPAEAGIKAGFYGTIWLMGLTVLFSVPVGVATAVYLEEFAPRNRLTSLIETNLANLAAVPSVVFGILGLGLFVRFFGLGPSLLAGGLTIAVMSLPLVVVASREAIRAVPDSIRLAALALGATRWQTVRRQVLPAALPGILTGVVLTTTAAIGETAPLLVIGAAVVIFTTPTGLHDQFSALPILLFNWAARPQPAFAEAAAAAGIVLLAMVGGMNAVAIFLRNRFAKRW